MPPDTYEAVHMVETARAWVKEQIDTPTND